jgi:GMP synthase (glutamine-hydrolysing)
MSESIVPSQKVIVVDFGAQYGQLIARRVRDLNVYSELVPYDADIKEIKKLNPSAVILSGGPASVYADDAPELNPEFLELGVPVLGICYGMQAMASVLGGAVAKTNKGEYGTADLTRADVASKLFSGTPQKQAVWMSHRDSVGWVPAGFTITASTPTTPIAAMEDFHRDFYAVQFHPEVYHTKYGNQILSNFLFGVVGLDRNWEMNTFIEDSVESIRKTVGKEKIILGLSGGVDSTVTAALVGRAVGNQLTCVLVDHGLMREGEVESIKQAFAALTDNLNLVVADASDRYLNALRGVKDPEKKRKIIGEEFWKVFFEEAKKLDGVKFLAQGTIYPDVIESGSVVASKSAAKIKSHHNMIPFPKGVYFEKIEPLRSLFKDEVRALGVTLGLPEKIVYRQPFPGPGLAIRIIGDVTEEKLQILRRADKIVREEISGYNKKLYKETGVRDSDHSVWQYFAVLPDIQSVGVMGDERTYERPIIVRAVESRDAMTADYAKLPYEILTNIATRIVDEVDGVNRVAYDITSKPPATIEWE